MAAHDPKFDTPTPRIALAALNLNAIGCNYVLNPAIDSRQNLLNVWQNASWGQNSLGQNAALLYETHPHDNEMALFASMNVQTDDLVGNNTLTVGGVMYNIDSAMRVASAFGRMFLISAANGTQYVLKVCKAYNDDKKCAVVSEALIQHIINQTTVNVQHTDCPYAMQVHNVFKLWFCDDHVSNEPHLRDDYYECFGIIMEYGFPWASAESALIAKAIDFRSSIIKLNRMLRNLQTEYDFCHGDLHAENVYYRDGVLKLIDFGKSSLTIGGILLHDVIEDPIVHGNADVLRHKGSFDTLYYTAYLIDTRVDVSGVLVPLINDAESKLVMNDAVFNVFDQNVHPDGNYLHWNVSHVYEPARVGQLDAVRAFVQRATPESILNRLNVAPHFRDNSNVWCQVVGAPPLNVVQRAARAAARAAAAAAAAAQVQAAPAAAAAAAPAGAAAPRNGLALCTNGLMIAVGVIAVGVGAFFSIGGGRRMKKLKRTKKVKRTSRNGTKRKQKHGTRRR